jgi:hypothetical protein
MEMQRGGEGGGEVGGGQRGAERGKRGRYKREERRGKAV